MTTIIYDGKTVAADSRSTSTVNQAKRYKCSSCGEHSEMVNDTTKKISIGKGKFRDEEISVIGGAGHTLAIKDAINYISNGGDIEKYIIERHKFSKSQSPLPFSLLIVTKEGVYVIEGDNAEKPLTTYNRDDVVGVGSGAKAAKLAIKLTGCNAIDAVAAASFVDDGTGGDIFAYDTTTSKMTENIKPKSEEEFKKAYVCKKTPVVPPVKATVFKKPPPAKQPRKVTK